MNIRFFLAALLGATLSGCATTRADGPITDFWSMPLRDCSVADRNTPRFTVMFTVRETPGIQVQSRQLRPIEAGRTYPDVVLRANGAPVNAIARGDGHESRGVWYRFDFDIVPLLRRHPDGFRLELVRGRRTLLRAELDGAAWAFGELLSCPSTRSPGLGVSGDG